jgi:oligopeptide transport system substrate-binding protein
MKKLSFLFLTALSVVVAGCTCKDSTPDTTEKSSHRLNLNIAEDPQTLDPRVVRNLRDLSLAMQLFEGLTRVDSSGHPIPAAAEKIETSADGLTYTFVLRPSKWTNEDAVTAFDFEYSWKKVLDPNFPTDYAHMLYPIQNAQEAKLGKCPLSEVGVRAQDERTLQVTLKNPTPYFLELTAFPTLFAVNKRVDEMDAKWALPRTSASTFVSNGPFTLADWKPSEIVVLKKSPTYWENGSVNLDEIVFSVIPDNMTESYLYEKGELDWLGQPLSSNISTELLHKLKAAGKLNSYSVAGTYWLKYNTKKAPFNDVRMRKAFAYAISRKQIKEHILQGNQQIASGVLPPSMTLKTEDLFIDDNTQLAKELFASYLADHPDTKITLSFGTSERNNKIMQFVADSWHNTFGIEIALEGIEGKVYRQKVKMGEFQVGSGEWIADFNDPISFLELFKYRNESGNGMNETGWSSNEFASIIDSALIEVDPLKRNALLLTAEKMLIDDMVVAPLYHYSFDYVKNEKVSDVVLSPLGPVDFKRAKKI